MKCQNCGERIPSAARICRHCGADTTVARDMHFDRQMLTLFASVGFVAVFLLTLRALL
jgi:predicted amidophosphoribosyltransferase